MTRKISVLVLAAHEPDLDPRIDWIARYAPADCNMLVLGFFDPRRKRDSNEARNGNYTLRRIYRERQSRRDAITWVLSVGSGGNSITRVKLYALLLFGTIVECPSVFLWAPIAVARRLFRLIEACGKSVWVKMPHHIRANLGFARAAWFGLRGIFRRVFDKLFEIRQRVQFRPNRLLVFSDVAQYFWGTTIGIKSWSLNESSVQSFQVVHANDLETLFAGVELKSNYGCSLVYDAHEFWPHSDVSASLWEIKFWETVERSLLKAVDRAFTVSQPLAAEMSKAYGRSFDTLPNAEPKGQNADLTYEVSRPVKFVFQGGFAEKRGVEQLILAWSRLRNVDAKLVLRGPESATRSDCVELARSLGLVGKQVEFAPSVEESALLDSLRGFDVGIIPYEPYGLNYRYCCPNKLSQYMKMGLAVLHNNLPFVNSVVAKAQCGWQYDGSVDDLAQRVNWIAKNVKQLELAKRNASRHFSLEFNWQIVSRGLYECYKELGQRAP